MQIFPYSDGSDRHYHIWNYILRQQLGGKIFKMPTDGGFDCPDHGGMVTKGGYTFCGVSGLGNMIITPNNPLPLQFQEEIQLIHRKWPTVDQHIVYFQNLTSTCAPVDVIRHRFGQVVSGRGVVGLSVGTRPGYLSDEVMSYLAELNERLYLWVKLDLRTTFEETSAVINRARSYQAYLDSMAKLRKHGVWVCIHLINGLLGETSAMMRENVWQIAQDSGT